MAVAAKIDNRAAEICKIVPGPVDEVLAVILTKFAAAFRTSSPTDLQPAAPALVAALDQLTAGEPNFAKAIRRIHTLTSDVVDGEFDDIDRLWTVIDQTVADYRREHPVLAPPAEAKPRTATTRQPVAAVPDEVAREPEDEPALLADGASDAERRHVIAELLTLEAADYRRQARSGLVNPGQTIEDWVLDVLRITARVGDRAFGGTDFKRGLNDVLDSPEYKEARRRGANRLVSTDFFPGGGLGEIDADRYRSAAGKFLTSTAAKREVALNPTFLWRTFTGGAALDQDRNSKLKVERLLSHLDRLSVLEMPTHIRTLAVLLQIKVGMNHYQRGIARQLINAQRGVVNGTFFTPDNARRFFEGQLTLGDNVNTLAKPGPAGKPVRFPRNPSLGETWGSLDTLKSSITSIGNLAFDSPKAHPLTQMMARLLSFDSPRAFVRPYGVNMSQIEVEERGRVASAAISTAWQAIAECDLIGADTQIEQAARARPDLFPPVVAAIYKLKESQWSVAASDTHDEYPLDLSDRVDLTFAPDAKISEAQFEF